LKRKGENQAFNVYMSVYCVLITNHVQFHKSTHHWWVFSPKNCSEPKTKWFKITGVCDVTNYFVTNQVNVWSSMSGSLSWC